MISLNAMSIWVKFISLQANTISRFSIFSRFAQFIQNALNRKELGQVEAMLGQIHQQQGDISRARKSYLEASRIFREVSDRLTMPQCGLLWDVSS